MAGLFHTVQIGDQVLARWYDGLWYLAAVKKINKDLRRCLVVYDDGCDITWTSYK
jgi:beta-phosphoglucomutase-like phosphatase (HAD superfamily)